MSEMVERVARAIYENDAESGFESLDPKTFWRAEGGYWPDHVWDVWITQARAAIEAMREPTEEMKLAGQALAYEGWGDGSEIARLSWQTMIDAALGKKP